MRPRAIALRRARRPPIPPSTPACNSAIIALRTFTANTSIRTRTSVRPQLPFLNSPSAPIQFRYLTTERKAWIRYELRQGLKYTAYFWILVACVAAGSFAITEEVREKRYPTPREWSFRSRMALRGARDKRDESDPRKLVDWVLIVQMLEVLVGRLEDGGVDGAVVVKDAGDGKVKRLVGEVTHGAPPGTKDISEMPEAWRRGYFEALMEYAKASEHVDGWVRDTTRNIVFPPDVVLGPSNPSPHPVPFGAASAPREEDCEIAFAGPDAVYTKILGTVGLTPRQRVEADLAYANWLEFKGFLGPADIIYEEAVMVASEAEKDRKGGKSALDESSWTLDEAAGLPSANLLKALTAHATFKARHGQVTSALPILVSLLRARRSLPKADAGAPTAFQFDNSAGGPPQFGLGPKLKQAIMSVIQEPPYPPPPPDGTSPPVRDAQELCEEAALQLHIGEILYTAPSRSPSGPSTGREEGIGWTREAVDTAEEQLHRLSQGTSRNSSSSKSDAQNAQTTCQECLATGLQNWASMVARLARDEAARKESGQQQGKSSGWLGLWGQGVEKEEDLSRWAAEEKVIAERQRRVKELLEDLPPPPKGLSSWLKA